MDFGQTGREDTDVKVQCGGVPRTGYRSGLLLTTVRRLNPVTHRGLMTERRKGKCSD